MKHWSLFPTRRSEDKCPGYKGVLKIFFSEGKMGEQVLGSDREVPPIHRHDKSLKVKVDAVIKAFQ